MRTTTALFGVVVVLALLSGCTVPPEWAARLNADGSIDYLNCRASLSSIEVDFHVNDDDWDAEPEWLVTTGHDDSATVDVALYGEVPEGWRVERTEHRPPPDWYYVSTSIGSAYRTELVEGEWVWFRNGTDWAWIPPRPCDGWELGPDGDPRRLS